MPTFHRFVDTTDEVPTRGKSHVINVVYFRDSAEELAKTIQSKLLSTYKDFQVKIASSTRFCRTEVEIHLHPLGRPAISLQSSSDEALNKSGDVEMVVREVDRLLKDNLAPNLFIRVHSCEEIIYDADVGEVEGQLILQMGGQEYSMSTKMNPLDPNYSPATYTFPFLVDKPSTQHVHVYLWLPTPEELKLSLQKDESIKPPDKAGLGVDILLDKLTINRTKALCVNLLDQDKGKVRLIFRATGPPFDRQKKTVLPGSPGAGALVTTDTSTSNAVTPFQESLLEAKPTLSGSSTMDRAHKLLLSSTDLPPFSELGVSGLSLTEDSLKELFHHYDKDHNGFISKEEFKGLYKSFESFGLDEGTKKVDALLKQYNMLGDDVLSYDEFSILILKLAQR